MESLLGNEMFPDTWGDKVMLCFTSTDQRVLGFSQISY